MVVVGVELCLKYGWIDVVCFFVLGIFVVNYGFGDLYFVYYDEE